MITVKFNDKGEDISLSVTGHAGAAERGKDTICASASILVYTAVTGASDMYTEGVLSEHPIIHMENGCGKVNIKPKPEYFDMVRERLRLLFTGFELLAENFPQYVEIKSWQG